MIIVCVGNGLGNQMFQYAFYKNLSRKYPKIETLVSVNFLQGLDHNGYELESVFGIHVPFCSKIEVIKRMTQFRGDNLILKTIAKLNRFRRDKCNHIYLGDGTFYINDIFNIDAEKDYIFDGVWCNEKYFYDVSDELLKEFVFQCSLSDRNNKYKYMIESENSVSLHIRGGDYLKGRYYRLDRSYYTRAIDEIKFHGGGEEVKIFLFTDDIDYASKILEGYNYIYVEGNTGTESYMDMYLMSLCKHNIIANSTFSFWGAYLNKNKNKIVVAPNKIGAGVCGGYFCTDWIVLSIDR